MWPRKMYAKEKKRKRWRFDCSLPLSLRVFSCCCMSLWVFIRVIILYLVGRFFQSEIQVVLVCEWVSNKKKEKERDSKMKKRKKKNFHLQLPTKRLLNLVLTPWNPLVVVPGIIDCLVCAVLSKKFSRFDGDWVGWQPFLPSESEV